MWAALKHLRSLPDDTRLYCGHEYTLNNVRFALTIDPDNHALQEWARKAEAMHGEGRLTIPSLLGDEKLANPFLRADVSEIASMVGFAGHPAAEVFAEVRARKDRFF